MAAKALEFFFSSWNLDPFRSILPGICLNIDTLTAFTKKNSIIIIADIINYSIVLKSPAREWWFVNISTKVLRIKAKLQ